jgi:predicted Ser/Thr protein kinase
LPSLHDIYCGRLLVKRNIVELQTIWESFQRLHKSFEQGRVIGLIEDLKNAGVINEGHVQKLKKASARHQLLVQEKLFAKIVLKHNHLTQDALRALVAEQKRNRFDKGLGIMLMDRAVISAEQLQELQAEQAINYAEKVSDSEEGFQLLLSELVPPFSAEQENKVLDALSLRPDRKPKTEGLWTHQEAAGAVAVTPNGASSSAESKADPERALYESSDNAFSNVSGRFPAFIEESSLRPEDCPIYGYEIIQVLGKGAMGVVYKARHIFTDRITALKVLPLRFAVDSQYLERFKREAIACMRLQHENIVRAYDFGGSEDYYYLALEYIDGQTLEDLINKQQMIAERHAIKLIRDVAMGLDFAWKEGILHRDIKPENIMITNAGQAKLCDFGIVKLIDMEDQPAVTLAGTTVGTPFYISPEQAKGEEDLDIRSDLYSLGITLFQMLTGSVPFTGKSQGAILVRHILEDVPDPRTIKPDLSPTAAELVGMLTRKKREERFQTPMQLVEKIDKLSL